MKTKAVAKLLRHDGCFESETQRLRAAQIWQLYSQSRVGLIGALLGALILVATLWNVVSHLVLVVWIASYALVQVARHVLISAFHRTSPSGEATFRWGAWFAVGTFLSGLLWGLAGVFLYPENSPLHQFVLSIFLAGITSAAAVVYSPITECYLPTILAGMLPLAARHIYDWDEAHLITGGVIVLFAAVLALTASRMHGFVVGSVRLRFEKDKLVESLQEARGELEMRVEERSAELKRTNEKLVAEIAERLRTEKSLRESENRFRSLIEEAPVGICFARNLSTLYANPKYHEMFGFSGVDELVGSPIIERIAPQCLSEFADRARRREEGLYAQTEYESVGLRKDGSQFPVQAAVTTVHLIDGPCSAGFFFDITERKRAEGALRESEAKYRSLVEQIPAIVYVAALDHASTTLYVSQQVETLVGFSPADYMADPDIWRTKLHPEDRERVMSELNKSHESGEPFLSEYRMITKDGETVWFLDQAKLVHDETGQLLCLQGVMTDITERKRAEEALRKSEEKYRSVVENMQDVFYRTDMQGTITMASPSGPQMIGYESVDQIIGLNVARDFYKNPDERDRMLALLQEKGAVSNFEVELVRRDGNSIIVSTNSHVYYDKSGQPLGVEGVFSNITERRRAEKALRESEALLKEAQRVAHIGHWEIDSSTGTPTWSEEIFHIFGLDPARGEPSFAAHQELIHPDDWDLLHESITIGTNQGIPFDIEFRLIRPDQSIRWMNAKGYPTGKQEGEFFRMFGTAQDITERKLAQQALVESEERFKQVAENAGEWIWEVDATGMYRYCSSAVEKIVGYSADELVGQKHFYDLFAPQVRQELKDLALAAFERKEPFRNFVNPNIHKNGEIRIIETSGSPVLDDQGTLLGYRGTDTDITERRKAGDAMRQQCDFLQQLIDTIPTPIFYKDVGGRYMGCNRAFESDTGMSRTDIVGKTVFEVGPLDLAQIYHEQDLSLLRNPGVQQGEASRQDAAGNRHEVMFTKATFPDLEGNIAGLVGVILDITERKQAEQALKASETRYRRLFEAAKDGILILDAGTAQIVDVNPFLTELLGYSRDDMLGKKLWEIELFADIAKSQTAFAELQSKEYARYEDLPIQTQAGKVVNVEFVSNVYVVNGSKVIQCNIRDITDRKRADEALRESEQEYQRLFEDAIDGICITKTDGTLIEANQAFLNLFGYRSREELIGRSLLALYIDPQDWTRLRQVIDQEGFVKDYSTRLQKKDGTEIDGHVTLRFRLNREGTIIGYRGMIRDVTEQNKLERELIQAQKMEAIGTLAGGVAHDFNNLLTVVLGFSELLLAEKDKKHPEYDDLQKIFHSAQSGAELVKRLLMFSRKSESKPVPMNLNNQIIQVEKLLRRTIPKMIKINLELSADLPTINADPTQVEQVLMNLAVNARDAMPDGGKLTVRTDVVKLDEEYCRSHIEAKPGDYVLLEVSDTGLGMDKQTAEHIFEPFFTTKEVGRGTGLGLAMVYGIVKQHDGHVTVYSEVGKETTFKVYLPAIPADAESEIEESSTIPKFGTETVLLVDDEEFVRELGARILTKHGYTVLKAVNGREALDLFKKERARIALVVLDLIMPEMGGTECLKELLNIDPQVNVLIASGFSADASVKETIQMGAKGFVTKPFRVKELLRDVRKVLDEG